MSRCAGSPALSDNRGAGVGRGASCGAPAYPPSPRECTCTTYAWSGSWACTPARCRSQLAGAPAGPALQGDAGSFIYSVLISVTFWLEVEARRRFPPTHPDVHSRVCSWRAEGHVRAPGQGSQAGPHVECAAVAGALALKPQQSQQGCVKSLSVGSEAAGQVRPPFPPARCGLQTAFEFGP